MEAMNRSSLRTGMTMVRKGTISKLKRERWEMGAFWLYRVEMEDGRWKMEATDSSVNLGHEEEGSNCFDR